ncbi:hypothetical protein [Tautonia rosea]|uniref:hypothetical protein n=1 Tax=Tautonia rosea TaxID=2728037 RepID=UPI0014737C39|nr:hypothetical protein [Tautonia rosea]
MINHAILRRMGLRIAVMFAASSVLTGCMSDQLRYTSSRLPSSLPDITQNQILTNLARTAADPSAIPFFALISDGVANVRDSGAVDASFQVRVKEFTRNTLGTGASREVTGNWSLKPTTNPDRLLAMRGAYRLALGLPIHPDEEGEIIRFLGHTGLNQIPAGFVRSGGKRDVPRKNETLYVGYSNGAYIWVTPDQAEAFARFTLVIQRLYLNELGSAGVNEIAPIAPRPPGVTPGQTPSRDFPPSGFNQGLFFVPR